MYSIYEYELKGLLESLEENTPEAPYEIELTGISTSLQNFGGILATYGKNKYVALSFGGYAKEEIESMTSISGCFTSCKSLVSIDSSAFGKIENAFSAFSSCTSLKAIDMSNFTNLTNADSMFHNCSSLEMVDISPLASVASVTLMFGYCTSLKEVKIGNSPNVTDTDSMFRNCTSLKAIDMSGFTNLTKAASMFRNCTSLETVEGFKLSINDIMVNTYKIRDCFLDCPSLKAIYTDEIPDPPEDDWHAWSVIRKTDGTASVEIFSTDGSLKASATVPCNADTICTIHGKCDELTFLENNEISDYDIAKMMKTRYPLTADEGCLDPSVSNFVLWAAPNSAVKSNIMSDIELSDYDFNDIFGGD